MVQDLGHLRARLAQVREQLDHHFLDEVPGIGPATLENLCAFIYNDLKATLPNIHRIKIERPASGDTCCLLPSED